MTALELWVWAGVVVVVACQWVRVQQSDKLFCCEVTSVPGLCFVTYHRLRMVIGTGCGVLWNGQAMRCCAATGSRLAGEGHMGSGCTDKGHFG
jgi:hypothetical protein